MSSIVNRSHGLLKLPKVLLSESFEFLDHSTFFKHIPLVCKHFYSIFKSSYMKFHSISIYVPAPDFLQGCLELSKLMLKFPRIKHLTLHGYLDRITFPIIFKDITQIYFIEKLTLYPFNDRVLSIVKSFSNIKALKVHIHSEVCLQFSKTFNKEFSTSGSHENFLSNLSQLSVEIDGMPDISTNEFSIHGIIFSNLSETLKILEFPSKLEFSIEASYALCKFLVTTKALVKLSISSSVFIEKQNLNKALKRNLSLKILHFLQASSVISFPSLDQAISLFDALNNSQIEDLSVIASFKLSNQRKANEKDYQNYFNAVNRLLHSCACLRSVSLLINQMPLNFSQKYAELIVSHAWKHNLTYFCGFHLKYWIHYQLDYFEKVASSYYSDKYYFLNLIHEIYKQIAEYAAPNLEISAHNHFDYDLETLSSDIQHPPRMFKFILLSVKGSIKTLNLKTAEISSENNFFLETLKMNINLKELSLCLEECCEKSFIESLFEIVLSNLTKLETLFLLMQENKVNIFPLFLAQSIKSLHLESFVLKHKIVVPNHMIESNLRVLEISKITFSGKDFFGLVKCISMIKCIKRLEVSDMLLSDKLFYSELILEILRALEDKCQVEELIIYKDEYISNLYHSYFCQYVDLLGVILKNNSIKDLSIMFPYTRWCDQYGEFLGDAILQFDSLKVLECAPISKEMLNDKISISKYVNVLQTQKDKKIANEPSIFKLTFPMLYSQILKSKSSIFPECFIKEMQKFTHGSLLYLPFSSITVSFQIFILNSISCLHSIKQLKISDAYLLNLHADTLFLNLPFMENLETIELINSHTTTRALEMIKTPPNLKSLILSDVVVDYVKKDVKELLLVQSNMKKLSCYNTLIDNHFLTALSSDTLDEIEIRSYKTALDINGFFDNIELFKNLRKIDLELDIIAEETVMQFKKGIKKAAEIVTDKKKVLSEIKFYQYFWHKEKIESFIVYGLLQDSSIKLLDLMFLYKLCKIKKFEFLQELQLNDTNKLIGHSRIYLLKILKILNISKLKIRSSHFKLITENAQKKFLSQCSQSSVNVEII